MTHLTRQILRQIESLGYRHEHAPDEGPDQVHLARIEGDDDAAYRCACALAESVGIDLRRRGPWPHGHDDRLSVADRRTATSDAKDFPRRRRGRRG
jgi:hypothetical protein